MEMEKNRRAQEWEYPKKIYVLPENAKSFGEKISAPHKCYIRKDVSTYDAGFAAGIEASARRCDKFLMENTNLSVLDVVDTLEYIRALAEQE
jgi:hypothetical protein